MLLKLYISSEAAQTLDDYVKRLKRSHPVRAVVVFGSAAKGGWNHRSDIDVLIVSDSMGTDWFERNLAAQKLSRGRIQAFVVTSDEVESAIESHAYLIWEALHDGVVVFDDGVFETARAALMELMGSGRVARREQGWDLRSTAT
ncbi:MAG: nucleotidyltransferase domain-containing protein [Candidatus Thorarchaeota archaeon]|nr:nucleotidyltransferase domain-containing protein [Candidatus Thorarchaeota archaeon]